MVTSLDPLLSGLTEAAARVINPEARVLPTANYFFMIASTFLLTGIGWWVTERIVAPRFDRAAIDRQVKQGGLDAGGLVIQKSEVRGLIAALVSVLVVGGVLLAMAITPGGPLTGEVPHHSTGRLVPVWSEALVPMIMLVFLVPGIAFGVVSGEIRSDRCVAKRMGESMASMGTYLVLAFFAGQTIAWFKQSNLSVLLGVEGGELIKSMGFGQGSMLASIVVVVAMLNLVVSSASAKWAFLAPILVPMLGTAGMSPDLVQVAYRVGDSCTNPIAPMNAYLVIILIAIRRWQSDAGLGTLIALLLPYCMWALVLWTAFLVAWNALGIPLGT